MILDVLADAAWKVIMLAAACGFLALIDEGFPKLWPAICRLMRRRYWRDRNRRHPIIKDWK